MKYEVQCEVSGRASYAEARKTLEESATLDELIDGWLPRAGNRLRLVAAIDEQGRLNGKVAVVLAANNEEVAWIEIPVAELKSAYPELISVRSLLQGCRRSDNWQNDEDEQESFSARKKALQPLVDHFPSSFDDDFCTGLLARHHVVPLALCYSISGCAEATLSRWLLDEDDYLAENSIWRKRMPASLSIFYQDPQRGHGFGMSYIFDGGPLAGSDRGVAVEAVSESG